MVAVLMTAELIDLAAVKAERRKREQQAKAVLCTMREVVSALSAGEGYGWLREDGAAYALADLVADRLRLERPDLFESDIQLTVEAAS